MIYYEAKINEITQAIENVKTLLAQANASISPSALQASLQNIFNQYFTTYKTSTSKELASTLSQKENELTELINEKLAALANQNLSTFLNTAEIKTAIETNFQNAHSSEILQALSGNVVLNESLKNALLEALKLNFASLPQETITNLTTEAKNFINENLESFKNDIASKINLAQTDINTLIAGILNNDKFKVALSLGLQAKLQVDTKLQEAIKNASLDFFKNFEDLKTLEILHLINQNKIFSSQQLSTIASALNIIQGEALSNLELSYKERLEARKVAYERALLELDSTYTPPPAPTLPPKEGDKQNIYYVI